MRRLLILAALAFPAAVPAQAAGARPPRDGVMSAFETFAAIFGHRLQLAFDSIPASRYGFQPTRPQQTVGYIAQHLEGANYALCNRMGALQHPLSPKDSLADTLKARWPKDTLVARLAASFRFCDSAMARIDKLDTEGEARTLLAFETDLAEHYSQIAGYMRQLHMVPPSALPQKARKAIDLPRATLAPYVGVYQLDSPMQLFITMSNDVLFIQSTGGATVRLWAESDGDFFIKEIDAQLTFVRDASGAVTGVVVHQFGRDRTAHKVS